jgi:hypothetical protein
MPLLAYLAILVMKGSDIALLTSARETYDKVASTLWSYVGITLMLRLIYNQLTFGGAQKVGSILVSLVTYSVLIFSTPQILTLVMTASNQISEKISVSNTEEDLKVVETTFSPSVFMSFSDWILALTECWAQLISTFLESIRVFVLCGLFALAPILIFMGTVLGFDMYRKIFFATLITVALWPIFSATLGLLALHIFKSKEQSPVLSKSLLLFIYSTLQGTLPFFTLRQALQPAGSGMNALFGMGKGVATVGSWSLNQVSNMFEGSQSSNSAGSGASAQAPSGGIETQRIS